MYDFSKYSLNLQKAINFSIEAARRYGSTYVGSEHVLLGILNVPACRACELLQHAGVDEEAYRRAFVRTLDKNAKIRGFTPRTKNMFDKALEYAVDRDGAGARVNSEYMLLAILSDEHSVAVRVLKMLGIDVDGMLDLLGEMIDGAEPPVPEEEEAYHAQQQSAKGQALPEYGTDLTQRAREG